VPRHDYNSSDLQLGENELELLCELAKLVSHITDEGPPDHVPEDCMARHQILDREESLGTAAGDIVLKI
jgi:hypothetical protein